MAFTLRMISNEPSGIAHLAAQGEAVAADFPFSHIAHFETTLGAKWSTQRVLLNMEGVPYLDSAAIGWMIGAQKQFRAAGGLLVLYSVQPPVRNVLNMLKVERVVPLAADVGAGRALLLTASKNVQAA